MSGTWDGGTWDGGIRDGVACEPPHAARTTSRTAVTAAASG